ncbi:proline-rich protein 5 isoform X2 [Patella vulgata]|uniref:proline-rich protein 5 isoform X2 n=1 Tax=Patella vulgata TaxID=6465 RepID=UPI00217F44BE|nr:proline-rich protein 5 isoform X2 [Patella vulgata]
MSFLSPGPRVSQFKRHSLANIDIGTRLPKGARRGSTLPTFLPALTSSDAATRQDFLESIQVAVVQIFQKKTLKENELGKLQSNVRYLTDTEAGPLIFDYYKDQLLKKGMVILREKIKNERGADLLRLLGDTWEGFFKEMLPYLQAILHPLKNTEMSIRDVTLLEFRNIVLLKVSVHEALQSATFIPPNVKQMLLVLQSVSDGSFSSENTYKLEKLVAIAVVPYLGLRGLYAGSPDPIIKAKSRSTPRLVVTEAVDSESEEPEEEVKVSLYSTWSPATVNKFSSRLNSIFNNKKLAPVLEHGDGGRRHSLFS